MGKFSSASPPHFGGASGAPRASDRSVIGTRCGQYLIIDKLGTGGMAEVLLAVDERYPGGERFVAIKRIRPDLASDPDILESFATECRLSLQTLHPNCAIAFDAGVDGTLPYLVLEYIPGPTVFGLLKVLRARGERLDVRVASAICLDIARALDALHSQRDVHGAPLCAVHRDVSPTNVMITPVGGAKLIDLGVARSNVQSQFTQLGIVKGKYAYMAPEQLAGERVLDGRADVFALGIILYELLTGVSLFMADSDIETVERVHRLVIASPRLVNAQVPPSLEAIVMKALERDLSRRYLSAAQLVEVLESLAPLGLIATQGQVARAVHAYVGMPTVPVWTREQTGVPLSRVNWRASSEETALQSAAKAGAASADAEPGTELDPPTEIEPPPPSQPRRRPQGSGNDVAVAPTGLAPVANVPSPAASGNNVRDPDLAYFLQVGMPELDGPANS